MIIEQKNFDDFEEKDIKNFAHNMIPSRLSQKLHALNRKLEPLNQSLKIAIDIFLQKC